MNFDEKDLLRKVEDLKKNLTVATNENSNEAQTDKLNIDFYKQELRKRDEYIKFYFLIILHLNE